ncbi:MAG: diguanylate cyclase [Lachnospiraceae bacterium]|nr:diguanylate cyclase [bacterium]MDY5517690.1 diguanylate cyclase [Lachnospiraceae bacterium]
MNITNLELTQATIEIFAGVICLLLAVIILMNGEVRNSWKQLKWMFLSTALIFFSEAAAYIFRGNTDGFSRLMTGIGNFVVFFLNLVLIRLFMGYMNELLSEKGATASKIYYRIVNASIVLNLIILVTNVFTKWMYYFDDANYYHRNTGWYVYTVINMVCIMTASVMCIHYRRSVKKTMFAALLVYAFEPLIAIIVQTFIYGISITNLGIAVAMLFMLLAYLLEWSKTKEIKQRRTLDIMILFVIMTIIMSASIFSCIFSIQRVSSRNSKSDSMVLAHMVSDSIEREFIKPIIVAETMSNDFSLKQYMKKSGDVSAESVEKNVAAYLESIKNGFGYQMVFAVCDRSGAYYTYDGISKYVDPENDPHDIWYKMFLDRNQSYDLDVDTDEANQWALSVFVNQEIFDENENLLGVCGVGMEMKELQRFIKRYEIKYNLKIDLIDQEGLIQVDSDATRIEQDYLEHAYLDQVGSDEFVYEAGSGSSRMTKYMEDLDWYLVVEDRNPNKINVIEITAGSIIIFVVGLLMMGIVFFVMSMRERNAFKELTERRKISLTDDMTGLFNRRAFEEDCVNLYTQGMLDDTIIMMMDVNGLKSANDNYGHQAGDELIIAAAKCIQTAVGTLGKAYRIGGDEFVVLLLGKEEKHRDVLNTLERLVDSAKCSYPCTLSISKGVVVCKEHPKLSFGELKALADKRMYADKEDYYRRSGKERRKI